MTDRLMGVPEPELEKCLKNMEDGLTLWENSITLNYTAYGVTHQFNLESDKIALPDGSIKTLKPDAEFRSKDEMFVQPQDFIRAALKTR